MNLVLVGRDSLDTLQEFTESNFSEIENKNLPRADWSEEVCYDQKHSYGKIFKIIPTKELKSLSLKWNLPATKSFNSTKSSSILSHIFGHEGPNSLLSELIKLSLATSLSAGCNRRLNESIDQLTISLSLTDKGELEYKRVIEVVYMYINRLK